MTESNKNSVVFRTFITAVEEVLPGLFTTEVKIKRIYRADDYLAFADINSAIKIEGDLDGFAVFSIEDDLAATLYSKMIGCPASGLSEQDKQDCAGEIINQVTGRVKTVLSEQDCLIRISVPQVIKEYTDLTGGKITAPVEAIDFECEGFNFTLQLIISLKQTAGTTT